MKKSIINIELALKQRPLYPTHSHDPKFWEALGRTVATFGFLEEVLAKAIFALTGTREYPESEIEGAYNKWQLTIKKALSDPLGALIDTFNKEIKNHPKSTISNIDDLVEDLKKVANQRNLLCHGSWRPPNEAGKSVPFFVNRKNEFSETAIDVSFLLQTQRHVAELCMVIMNTVTHMGWQFPGSNGPGNPIWISKS